ncbi:hypothetical protein WISP_145753 [Willisornis vidua]|uniref:Uncharacterized protein n=1 Tax=Willisornis vidua TaxID=1566151 RepID=A0ABQ9CL11_9PASS|nr:hypothetical protein WISP_145753 [Willisornis vidua]
MALEGSLEATTVADVTWFPQPGPAMPLFCLCSHPSQKLWLTILQLKGEFHSLKPNLNLAKKTWSKADQTYQSLGLASTILTGSKSLNKYQLQEISDIAGEVFQVSDGAKVKQNPEHVLEPPKAEE